MDSDLIQVAAYVIIFIIIAGASIVRKVIEAQKKRQELEARRRKMGRAGMQPPAVHADRPIEPAARQPERLPYEDEPEPEEKPAPTLDLEDILRKAFGVPAEKARPRPRIRVMPRPQHEPPAVISAPRPEPVMETQPAESAYALTGEAPSGTATHAPEVTSPGLNWQEFIELLDEKDISGIKQAVVLTEIFNKPPALKRRSLFLR